MKISSIVKGTLGRLPFLNNFYKRLTAPKPPKPPKVLKPRPMLRIGKVVFEATADVLKGYSRRWDYEYIIIHANERIDNFINDGKCYTFPNGNIYPPGKVVLKIVERDPDYEEEAER
jgi:hypothetical protein